VLLYRRLWRSECTSDRLLEGPWGSSSLSQRRVFDLTWGHASRLRGCLARQRRNSWLLLQGPVPQELRLYFFQRQRPPVSRRRWQLMLLLRRRRDSRGGTRAASCSA
jgi:hypothetical protein